MNQQLFKSFTMQLFDEHFNVFKISVLMLAPFHYYRQEINVDFNLIFFLNKGAGVMVESPTYYHSLSPVLRSLKEFDMENFPLQAEIIYADKTSRQPNYLQQADTVDTSPIYKKNPSKERIEDSCMFPDDISDGTIEFARFFEVFNAHSSTSLEASQFEALKQALTNRLAIIQGEKTKTSLLS